LARVRSYSSVQRSGMISAAGVMVRHDATPHRQGPKRGATNLHDAKQRRQPPTAHVLQRTLSPAALAASPVAAMLPRRQVGPGNFTPSLSVG
jgi:hypothetical protein